MSKMEITITWHFIVMIIATIYFIIRMFNDNEGGLDLSFTIYGAVIIIIWAIYGGIFLW